MRDLTGKSYTFEDGNKIEVFQIKNRETNGESEQWVTYFVHQGPGVPRKLIMPISEFMSTYGHLFPE